MKKLIASVLAVSVLLCCLMLPAAAQSENGVISLRLNSDVAGCTERDVDEIAEILSPQLVWYHGNSPVSIANYAGGTEYAHMEAGRSYSIVYTLEAAEGYTLPEELSEGDISLDCGKGVSVVYCRTAEMWNGDNAPRLRVLRICAKVIVDSNPFQRIIGWFRDVILKIRSFQID